MCIGQAVGKMCYRARACGAFDKYGVTVDIQYIETATAVAAMVSNNIDAEEVSAAPIITADADGINAWNSQPDLFLAALPT